MYQNDKSKHLLLPVLYCIICNNMEPLIARLKYSYNLHFFHCNYWASENSADIDDTRVWSM